MSDYALEENPVEALKSAFRRHASGVAIITTTNDAGEPVGFTATSVTSLGATPPLLTFNVARGASSWPAVARQGHVAIHILREENVELAKKLAGPHEERFVNDDWAEGPHGLPIFKDVAAVIIGKTRQIVDVEANAVVIVDVLSGLVCAEQGGLLYHHRNFVGLGSNLG
jgi:flavin reductase (DIM6/NTAB) family NADH-FMN oxidoreductase RutF